MEKAELVIVRGNLCFGEVRSLDFLPNYTSRSPQEFLSGWKWLSVQFSVCKQCSCREQLCLPGAVGSPGMALQILLVSEGNTFAKLRGD